MQGFMVSLLICSATMSALVLLYMALTPLLEKRYSVTGRYYTWLILVIGLIVPFRPHFNNAIVKIDMPGTMIQTGNGAFISAPNVRPQAVPSISWWQAAAVVWLAGVIIFLAYHAIKHYRFWKLAERWSENITEEQTLLRFQTLKIQMGLSGKIGLQSCSSIGTPMMVGFVRPRILLPKIKFAEDALHFILKHELVHYKRKDLFYKCLVLTATALHWFNPIVYWMAKAIAMQCELSCDKEVIRGMGADMRQCYSETIIGVARYQSRRKTVLSTNFYGGKKGMKNRIFSIMDRNKKKAGAAVLCCTLVLTLGTGFAFAANRQSLSERKKGSTMAAPALPIAFLPDPDIYAVYAAFGITISEDGTKLLYEGQPVGLFADEKSDVEAFYWDEAGDANLSVVRDADGEITGMERITVQKAKEYQEAFFAEELDPGFFGKVQQESLQDMAMVKETVSEGGNKYGKYQPFGITYSVTDEALYFNGAQVRFLIDQPASGSADALWTDDAGTVNLAAVRDASGQMTGIERISDETVQKYQSAAEEYEKSILDGLEESVEAKVQARYPEN